MPRKPVSVEAQGEGDARYVVLTYADGDVVKSRVDPDRKPTRRPRRSPTRIKTIRQPSDDEG